jgi:hypothetical protein
MLSQEEAKGGGKPGSPMTDFGCLFPLYDAFQLPRQKRAWCSRETPRTLAEALMLPWGVGPG